MQSRLLKSMSLALIALALPVLAFAQTSRVEGMNIQGDYIKDYTNIYTFTSCVNSVGNLVYGEFGNTGDFYLEPVAPNRVAGPLDNTYNPSDGYFGLDDRAVGAVLGNLWDGRYGTISFHLREFSPQLGQGDSYSQPFPGYNGGYDPNNFYGYEQFDVMWGKKFGNTSVGLRLNRANFKFTSDDGTNTTTTEGNGNTLRNEFGLGGGIGFELNPNSHAELSFLYQSRTFTTPLGGGAKQTEDGAGAYLFSARMLWQWEPNVLVVPVFKYASYDLSYKYDPTTAGVANDRQWRSWSAGIAGNWTLNQNDLFVAGVTFASNVDDQKTNKFKYTESQMPSVFAALETHVNPWLTIRFGARKTMFYSNKFEDNNTPRVANDTKENSSTFSFNTGAGIKVGTLQFDGVLAQDFFNNPGSYLPTNSFSDFPLFPKITATYSF